MRIKVKAFAYGVDMFIPGTVFGQTIETDVPVGATVGDVFDKLGIPRNVFAVLVNKSHATVSTPLIPGDTIVLLETTTGG